MRLGREGVAVPASIPPEEPRKNRFRLGVCGASLISTADDGGSGGILEGGGTLGEPRLCGRGVLLLSNLSASASKGLDTKAFCGLLAVGEEPVSFSERSTGDRSDPGTVLFLFLPQRRILPNRASSGLLLAEVGDSGTGGLEEAWAEEEGV